MGWGRALALGLGLVCALAAFGPAPTAAQDVSGESAQARAKEQRRRAESRAKWTYGPQLGLGFVSGEGHGDSAGYSVAGLGGRFGVFAGTPRFGLFSMQFGTGMTIGPSGCEAERAQGPRVCGKYRSVDGGGLFRFGPVGGRIPFVLGLGGAVGRAWLGALGRGLQATVRGEVGFHAGHHERFELVARLGYGVIPELEINWFEAMLLPSFSFH